MGENSVGKKLIVLGFLAQAAGLAVLGTAAAQSPQPAGARLPAPQYGMTPATGTARPVSAVPPAAQSVTRPFTDWTPTVPPNYQPSIPQPYTGARPTPTHTALPPAGAGLGAGVATAPAPTRPARPMTDTGIRPVSGVDLPPPDFGMPSGKPSEGVRPAGGGIPAPTFAPAPSVPTPVTTAVPPLPGPDMKFPSAPTPTAPEFKPTEPFTTDLKPTPPPALATPMPSTPPMVAAPAPAPMVPPAPTVPTPAPVAIVAAPSPMEPLPSSPMVPSTGALPARLAPSVIVEAFAPDTVNFGQEFKYDLLVRNTGAVAVSDVKISDELPNGSRFLSSDPPAEVNGDHLSWGLGIIEPGADRRITVRIKPAEEGEIRSRATVSFSTSVDAKTRVTRPRISVALTGPEVARVGEEAAFVIKVTNTGTGPATKLMLKAMLTEGLFCPKVPSAGGNEIETVLADVKPGETKSIKLPVAAARAGMQSCQIVAATEGSPESTARVAVNVVEALLQLKQAGPAHCLVRSEPTYTIDLANPGTAATDPLSVYSVLPDGFEYVQASDGGVFNGTTRAVTWRLPSLPAGGTRQVTLKMRSVSACDGMLRTLAQGGSEPAPAPTGVTPVSATSGPRALEAKAETQIHSEGVPAIRFEVLGVEGLVEVGKEAVYEIRVTNQGTGACSNVQLVAALAEGTTYTGSNGPTQIKAQGQQLVFDPIATLGVKGELVYRVRIRGTVPGDQRLRVQLTCDQVTNPVVKEESTRFYQQ